MVDLARVSIVLDGRRERQVGRTTTRLGRPAPSVGWDISRVEAGCCIRLCCPGTVPLELSSMCIFLTLSYCFATHTTAAMFSSVDWQGSRSLDGC